MLLKKGGKEGECEREKESSRKSEIREISTAYREGKEGELKAMGLPEKVVQ